MVVGRRVECSAQSGHRERSSAGAGAEGLGGVSVGLGLKENSKFATAVFSLNEKTRVQIYDSISRYVLSTP